MLVLAEHLHQQPLGLHADGQHHYATGIAIQTMNEPHPRRPGRLAAAPLPGMTTMQNPHHQLVDRRLTLLAASGPVLLLGMPLGRHSGRLLDDDQVRVLKEDLDIIRVRRGIARLVPDLHDIARLQLSSFVET